MAMLAFYAGTVIGVLIGVVLMALLSMAKDVEQQEEEDIPKFRRGFPPADSF